jgi:hypothetical protein
VGTAHGVCYGARVRATVGFAHATNQAFSSAITFCTAGRSDIRLR